MDYITLAVDELIDDGFILLYLISILISLSSCRFSTLYEQ